MKTLAERFWPKVQKVDACWLWRGSLDPKGYGRIAIDGVNCTAHRTSWELTFGEIPFGLYVCHHCDNPPCVRPCHLFLGTASDNTMDAVKKGRVVVPRRRWSKLTENDVHEIRILLDKGQSQSSVAQVFKVSSRAINLIKNGKRWGWLA